MLNATPAQFDGEQRVERGTERNSVHGSYDQPGECAPVRQSRFGRRKDGSALASGAYARVL